MKRREFLGYAAAAGAAALALPRALPAAEAAARKPNIIVILVDDMGWSDISCYGSEIPTPSLDRLAANGIRFTQFYNTARCCPTRASILTGLYPHQIGVGHMVGDDGTPGYRGRLNDQCVTLAEVLRGGGYFTAMTGKWHVGQEHGVVPWQRGFDHSLNAPAGGFYYAGGNKARLFLNGKELANDDPVLPKNWYITDLWTDFALRFIDESLPTKKPFFLYLAHNAPHFPLQAPAEDIAKFRGKYLIGWDKLREERHKRQIAAGLVDKAWAMSLRPPEVKPWDQCSAEEKDRFDLIMAIYAAVVAHMDASVGRLVEGLQKRGLLDNTLILFLSDNGGNAESGPNGTLKGDPPGGPASTVFCGQSWATLQNTPFRRYKHYNHEGGISTPLIAHWPAGIPARGELRHQPGHLIDIMATCADVGAAPYPKEFNGKPILPMEGTSLVPAFTNKPLPRDALYWEHEGNAAVRVGDYKLVRKGGGGQWELYDLVKDRTELGDLAGQMPDKVKELAAKWNAWAERCHVLEKKAGGTGDGSGAAPPKKKKKAKA
jgi:arylsulfatase